MNDRLPVSSTSALRIFRPVNLIVFVLVAACFCSALGAAERIHLGIDHLQERNFRPLWGKRVGLLTNPAGVNRFGRSTIEVLRASDRVQLVALFGPEHGIYGNEKANEPIPDRIDPRTNLPVHSLYGAYRKPTPEMLANIDTLVIDLQDVGVRSYTYVSCMRLAMQACFEQGKEVVVLDRPNPLGGLKVDGPMLDKRFESYVGAFPVPYVHGLTIGELARMLKEVPGWLGVEETVRLRGRLVVVPMKGWRRRMLWSDTGLDWVPTSPAIPDLAAAFGYSMTGLGAQLGNFRHGYGTEFPFRLLTYEGKAPHQIQAALQNKNIPGLSFKSIRFKRPNGEIGTGVYVIIDDWNALRPTEISFWMMQIAATWGPGNPFRSAPGPQALLFNKHVGSEAWWQALISRGSAVDVRRFVEENARKAKAFQRWSQRFWIYQ